MFMIFGIPAPLLFGQLLLGLINGAFYAMLSLGLAIIFGMLNIINFAHGALFMMGAFVSWMLLNYLDVGYFPALILAPLLVGIFGLILEKTIISRLYKLDHLYGLLLTFGLALVIEACSATPMAAPVCRTAFQTSCRVPPTSASCTCPTIAAGWWCARWWSALPPGRSSRRHPWVRRCGRRRKTRRWCRRSASTCRG